MKKLLKLGYRVVLRMLHFGYRVVLRVLRLQIDAFTRCYQSFEGWQRERGRTYVPERIQIPFYLRCLKQAVPLPNSRIVLGDWHSGFFAVFNAVMGAVYFAKKYHHNLVLDFKEGQFAVEGRNWWLDYFEKDTFCFSPAPPKQEASIHWNEDLNIPWSKSSNRHLHRLLFLGSCLTQHNHKYGLASDTFKLLGLKAHIQRKADDFFEKTCAGHYVIGVHYRGTDVAKRREKSFDAVQRTNVPFRFVFSEIERAIKRYGKDEFIIFVASDEQDFVDSLCKAFPKKCVFTDAFRSPDGNPIHASEHFFDKETERGVSVHGQKMAKIGEEVLIDMLVLSKCDVLLRFESEVSKSCHMINPTQPVINMAKRYRWRKFFLRSA